MPKYFNLLKLILTLNFYSVNDKSIKLNCINLSYNNISNITSTNRLTQVFPLITEMDLEGNLLNSWNQIFGVLNELKNLRLINVR